jgi:hypothetical protein
VPDMVHHPQVPAASALVSININLARAIVKFGEVYRVTVTPGFPVAGPAFGGLRQ